MKVRRIWMIVLSVILALGVAAFAGCGNREDANKTKLKVSIFKAGFGDEWLHAIAAEFEKIHRDVKVVIDADVNMDTLVRSRLEAKQYEKAGDIFSVTNLVFFDEFIRKEYVEDLTSLFGEEVEKGKTLIDVVDGNFMDFVTKQEKFYGVPWEGAVTGFAYNTKMFALYGWEVPETMADFYELCGKIKEKGIAPLVYCGANSEGYLQNPMMSWMAQYEGVAGTEEFFALESPEVFKNQGRLKAYEEAARIVADKNIVLTGSKGNDHLAAQREFIKGNAAMIPAGSWLQTEMSEFLSGYPNFEMGMFAPPYLTDDKTDKNGDPARLVSTGNCDVLSINSHSKNKELAREFLLFMSRQDMLELYSEKTGGNPRPFHYENTDWSKLGAWGKSVMECWQKCDNIFPYSSHQLFLSGKIGFWNAEGGKPITYLQSASSVADALSRASKLWNDDYTIAVGKY